MFFNIMIKKNIYNVLFSVFFLFILLVINSFEEDLTSQFYNSSLGELLSEIEYNSK